MPPDDADSATWRTLFGSLGLSHCEHCRSLLSPAAYLVDILACLRGEGVLDMLLERRPDVARIECRAATQTR
jgi:hypothetical protein